MKAYNSPTDELHIKSNSGEELVKITPNETTIKNMDLSSLGIESTPEEIDAAVAKADAIPETTVADAGKVVGVTPEGKIGLIDNGGFEYYNMQMDGITIPLYTLLQNIVSVQGGESKTAHVLIFKADNEIGYESLRAAIKHCADNRSKKIILTFVFGDSKLDIPVNYISLDNTNEIMVTSLPAIYEGRSVITTYYLSEESEGNEQINVTVYVTGYEEIQ